MAREIESTHFCYTVPSKEEKSWQELEGGGARVTTFPSRREASEQSVCS